MTVCVQWFISCGYSCSCRRYGLVTALHVRLIAHQWPVLWASYHYPGERTFHSEFLDTTGSNIFASWLILCFCVKALVRVHRGIYWCIPVLVDFPAPQCRVAGIHQACAQLCIGVVFGIMLRIHDMVSAAFRGVTSSQVRICMRKSYSEDSTDKIWICSHAGG